MNKSNLLEKKLRWLYFVILSVVLVGLDYVTKQLAIVHLMHQDEIELIPNVLELRYLENRGAAFGIFQGGRIAFTVIACIVMLGIVLLIKKIPENKRFVPLFLAFTFVFSGAMGNQIDRMMQGYVVDFIYFSIIDFPIFNVADIYVSVTTVVLICLLLFYYKDEELHFLGLRSK